METTVDVTKTWIIPVIVFGAVLQSALWIWLLYLIYRIEQNTRPAIKETKSQEVSENVKWRCPKCNAMNPNNTYTCQSCNYKLL